MKFGKYTCTVRLQRECLLPEFKGSTLRGSFGWALKRAVCIFKGRDCSDCMVRQQCIYARTFEPFSGEAKYKDIAASSPPYCFEPPLDLNTHWLPGSTLKFSLLLFGENNDYLPYYIYALEKMGSAGIGMTMDKKRCPFTLVSVKDNDRELYDSGQMKMTGTPRPVDLQVGAPGKQDLESMGVNLLSPLRIKSKQSFQEQLPFHLLMRGILRRVSSLFTLYDKGEPDLDYTGLIQRAERVKEHFSDLSWVDYQRYSSRQKQKTSLGGMTGEVTYQGDLTEFAPLLHLGSLLHIGKQTSFGLGRFEFRAH
jgi:hypothetical protein